MEPLPIWIFSKDEELVVVLGDSPQGCPYYDAVLTETLNGVDKLEFSIPGDHPRAEYVVRGCIAVVQTVEGAFRAFRIKTHTQGFGEDGIRYRQFYAEDIAVDELNAAPVIDRRPNNPLDALIGALENSLWEVGQVDSGFPEASTNFYHETAMSCLQKMAETWGGEFRFRIEHDGRRITARYVDFLRQRGEDTGFRVTVGKNMRTLEGEEDITALATALYGYGRGEEHEETGGFGRRISFADVEWKKENGDPVDKPLGQEWVGDPEALAVWGLQGGTVHRFDFVIFEDVEDPEELLRLTWEELQRRKAPQVNYRVGLIDLEYTEGRSHEATRIGNWGIVIDDDFKPPLEFKARVIERKIPLRNPERTELTLGHIVPTLTDIVNRADRNSRNAIQIGDPISLLDSRFQTLTDELHKTPGYVYITPTDGLMVTDKPKDQNPTSAIQLKGGMLAIANEWNPAKGDFNWRAFGTGDGFTADMLNAGRVRTNLVTVGDDSGSVRISGGNVTIKDGGLEVYSTPDASDNGVMIRGNKIETNFIRNPDFRNPPSGDHNVDWRLMGTARYNSSAQRIEIDGEENMGFVNGVVQEFTAYHQRATFLALFRCNVASGAAPKRVRFVWFFYDENGNRDSNDDIYHVEDLAIWQEWHLLKHTVDFPSYAHRVRVYVQAETNINQSNAFEIHWVKAYYDELVRQDQLLEVPRDLYSVHAKPEMLAFRITVHYFNPNGDSWVGPQRKKVGTMTFDKAFSPGYSRIVVLLTPVGGYSTHYVARAYSLTASGFDLWLTVMDGFSIANDSELRINGIAYQVDYSGAIGGSVS